MALKFSYLFLSQCAILWAICIWFAYFCSSDFSFSFSRETEMEMEMEIEIDLSLEYQVPNKAVRVSLKEIQTQSWKNKYTN